MRIMPKAAPVGASRETSASLFCVRRDRWLFIPDPECVPAPPRLPPVSFYRIYGGHAGLGVEEGITVALNMN